MLNDPLVREIAAKVEDYLQAACSFLSEPSAPAEEGAEGWYAQMPGSPVYGRTPWVNMSEVLVRPVGRTVVVSFCWQPESSDRKATYVLPLEAPDVDAIGGSDKLITLLDFRLEEPDWQRNAHLIGEDLYVLVLTQRC
ncbi:hypothetical protein O4214_10420 [Rhodococcus erythropolis]|uniref:hypothetical protein n=1 Tax=Rhodococcus erythropolis TaxID=1833 RepID=UPI001E3F9089|nr:MULTISPECIES: hypothetical protein [Rhodococcus erythropolis group]MCD2105970.1 hypothetical protein [Rhodococcus qingshengii]MCZ4524394.1 hypothetical protein [Rhodococcus erythropolis]